MFQRLTSRLNKAFRRNAKPLGMKTAYEDMFKTNSDRYTDRLVIDGIQNIMNPVHRERVAYEDPLCRLFTWDFQMKGWDEYPKFYESDQLDAPEIMPEVRALLMDLKFHQPAIVQGVLKQIHGWETTIMDIRIDQTKTKLELDYTIFSERQCYPQDIIREGKQVKAWRVQLFPQLPLNRTPMSANLEQITIPNGKPNILFDTRGEELSSWGYGYSKLEHLWDPITKLRLESDADSFRKAIFPISIYPPDWEQPEIDKFFEKMSNLSRTTAAAFPAAQDGEGKLYDTIPSLTFMSPSDDAKQSGSGQFGGLSSEWTRLLSASKHTMGYITGGGAISASQSAAGVDLSDDEQENIYEWNLINKTYIRKFLTYLEQKGVIELPPSFTIKCAWQWKHDEMMVMQSLMAENQILAENEAKSQQKEEKENALVDTLKQLIDHRKTSLTQSQSLTPQPTPSGIPPTPNNSTTVTKASKIEPATYKGDPQGLGWQPVQSASGNVKRAAMIDDQTIIVDYEGGMYEYSDKDGTITGRGTTMKQVFDAILTEGGEATWEYLRAPLAVRAKDIAGREADPSGYMKGKYHAPKGPKGPYTGSSHYADYKKISRDPTAKRSIAEGSPMMKELELNSAFATRHPILQRANSISEAVKDGFYWNGKVYHSKSKAYEILDMIRTESRNNSMHMGNSFSTKNPFKYEDRNAPEGYVVEYQCPESIKKLIGTKWPMWIDHRGDRTNEDYVGIYEITGFDEEGGIEIANYDIDWDLVDQWFERSGQSNFTKLPDGQRIIPDTSTEYKCNIKYDKTRNIFIQTDFDMAGVAIVPRGNCASPYCQLNETN